MFNILESTYDNSTKYYFRTTTLECHIHKCLRTIVVITHYFTKDLRTIIVNTHFATCFRIMHLPENHFLSILGTVTTAAAVIEREFKSETLDDNPD